MMDIIVGIIVIIFMVIGIVIYEEYRVNHLI
jgi:hypothetical protein